jgi:heparin/heparan-sulfate lyase
VLVYDPGEHFFWSDNVIPAVNDGGQRMNSSRYWNTIRSEQDWNRTRDLWDTGSMRVVDHIPGQYHYALGDATGAYSKDKLTRFTREIVYIPEPSLLFVYDRVVSTHPSFRKAWLLHGVNQPSVDQDVTPGEGTKDFTHANTFRFREGSGELLVHSLLPLQRVITRRGGTGNEFYTPGDDHGGRWGTGENWPLEPPEGGPLPQDPKLNKMWKTFWGNDFDKILRSNRKNVVPGNWRIEVSPSVPAAEDFFLHVFEIGDRGKTGQKGVELLDGVNFKGAAFENGPAVLFNSAPTPSSTGEVSLPGLRCNSLLISGLHRDSLYELNFGGLNIASAPSAVLPGVSAGTIRTASNAKGLLRIDGRDLSNLRLRIAVI